MLLIEFSGWFQCRLAIDPDPWDEKRGVSGFTRAVAGEPDLDRIIRFHRPVAERKPGPTVGVEVNKATLDGNDFPALVGARVDLLPDPQLGPPKYEGRNGLEYDDQNEPVMPFHLQIAGSNGVLLERQHRDPVSGQWTMTTPDTVDLVPWLMEQATGSADPGPFFRKRRQDLMLAMRRAQPGSVEQVGLRSRRIDFYTTRNIMRNFLSIGVRYRIELAGPWARIADPQGIFGGHRISTEPWICTFWMGVWDNDALCGFVSGNLAAPIRC